MTRFGWRFESVLDGVREWPHLSDGWPRVGFVVRHVHVGVDLDESSLDGRQMRLRYAGTCRECATALPARTEAVYFAADKHIECLDCFKARAADASAADLVPDVATPDVLDPAEAGTAGASARREYERRAAKREKHMREKHPRIGGCLLALSDDPQSTRAWQTGAAGEERLAARLDSLVASGVLLLHDRRIPRSSANIDHIAVAPTGVWVIDAKRYRGRPHLRVEGGVLRPRVEKLLVGSRDCSKLLTGVQKQVAAVRDALERGGFEHAPVNGMLCFVEADWPLIGGAFRIDGIEVLWPKKAVERISPPGPIPADRIIAIQRQLATAFPNA